MLNQSIPTFFQTIAEVSVAIGGFSGLIIVLRKSSGPLTVVQQYRLRVLLSLSFGAMFLSLLPELLVSFDSELAVWNVSSFVFCVYSIIFLIWWTKATFQVRRTDPQIFHWFAFYRMMAGHIAIVIVQLAFLASFIHNGAAIFAAALIWYLLHAAQQFTRMLFFRAKSDDIA